MTFQNTQKVLALLGILGPIVYAMVLIIIGALTPGYNHITQVMSVLGSEGYPFAVYMNIFGFMFLGIFGIIFAIALRRGITVCTKGPVLVTLASLALIAVGFLPCDPGCNTITVFGTIHSIVATIPAIIIIMAMFVFSYSLSKDKEWKGYSGFSFYIGALTTVFSLLFVFDLFVAYEGLIQRLIIFFPLLWMLVMSSKIYKLANHNKPTT